MPTYPLTNLHDIAQFAECRFALIDRQETARVASGVTQGKDLGPPLWTAQFQTIPMRAAEARRLRAWLNSLQGVVGTFSAYDVRFPRPISDPTGAASLGAVQINSTSNGTLSLKGLPAGFVVSAGDYLAFDWGTGPRRAFHEVSETVAANGSGVTAVFETRPRIRSGAAVNAAVTLVQPRAVWRLDPGGFQAATVGTIFTQFSFTATQVV